MEKLYLVPQKKLGRIAPEIYGVFTEHIGACVYDGIYCGDAAPNIRGFRKSIIDDLRALGTPLVRWPGGCFAETYDWRDGIGPVESRPVRLNWWTQHDGKYEPNLVGTDEFLDFAAQVFGVYEFYVGKERVKLRRLFAVDELRRASRAQNQTARRLEFFEFVEGRGSDCIDFGHDNHAVGHLPYSDSLAVYKSVFFKHLLVAQVECKLLAAKLRENGVKRFRNFRNALAHDTRF